MQQEGPDRTLRSTGCEATKELREKSRKPHPTSARDEPWPGWHYAKLIADSAGVGRRNYDLVRERFV